MCVCACMWSSAEVVNLLKPDGHSCAEEGDPDDKGPGNQVLSGAVGYVYPGED